VQYVRNLLIRNNRRDESFAKLPYRCYDCIVVGYTMDTMYFTWLDRPVDVDKDLQLPQFFLVDTPKYDCSQNYTAGIE